MIEEAVRKFQECHFQAQLWKRKVRFAGESRCLQTPGAPGVPMIDASLSSLHKLLFSEVYGSVVKIHSEFTLGLHQVSVYQSLF